MVQLNAKEKKETIKKKSGLLPVHPIMDYPAVPGRILDYFRRRWVYILYRNLERVLVL